MEDYVEIHKVKALAIAAALEAARKDLKNLKAECDGHTGNIGELQAKIAALEATEAAHKQTIEILTAAFDGLLSSETGGSVGGNLEPNG